MRCTVKFFLDQVTCPGTLHLPDRNPVYVTICLFGRLQRSQHVYPSFPMALNTKIKFQRLFTNAKTPEHVLEILEDETILIELRQHTKGLKGGNVLAEFEESTRSFLFPSPSYIPKRNHLKRDVLLSRTEYFPIGKGIDPQLSFRTKTYIEEGPDVNKFHPNLSVNRQVVASELSSLSKHGNSILNTKDKVNKSLSFGSRNVSINDCDEKIDNTAVTATTEVTKQHCVCGCPNIEDDPESLFHWLEAIIEQKKKKSKPFRAGNEPQKLIAKREFDESTKKKKTIKRKGICESCVVSSPSCILCNAYKSVYGPDYYILQRFKDQNAKIIKGRRKSKSDADCTEDTDAKSGNAPANVTADRDEALKDGSEVAKDREEVSNDRGKESKQRKRESKGRKKKSSKHRNNDLLLTEGNLKTVKPKPINSYIPSDYITAKRDFPDDNVNYERPLPPRATSSRISAEPDPLFEEDRLTRSAPPRTKVHASPLFKRGSPYGYIDEDLYDLEVEQIHQRVRNLMKKNNSVLQYELSSSDSITDDEYVVEDELFSGSSTFDDSPVALPTKKKTPIQKKTPSRSAVLPLSPKKTDTNWIRRSAKVNELTHRDKLDSRLKEIYADLYEKTLKNC